MILKMTDAPDTDPILRMRPNDAVTQAASWKESPLERTYAEGRNRKGVALSPAVVRVDENIETMKTEPTVFVVDADGPTRDAIRDLAYTMNLRCKPYASGHEFLNAYAVWQPGCLVLEVRIPDINGFDIQERLAAQGATIPTVFLTGQATVSIAVRAMRAGALHFLEKPLRENELWDVIEEAILVDQKRRCALVQREELEDRLAKLTPKERQLLGMIARGKSKNAIASQLGVCVRTVELRRKQLMKQLGMSSLVELVHFALLACDGHPRALDGMRSG